MRAVAANRASWASSRCVRASHALAEAQRSLIPGRIGRLQQDAQVGRLLLHGPVLPGKCQRAGRVLQKMQREARLLAQMHAVATQAARRVSTAQFVDAALPDPLNHAL